MEKIMAILSKEPAYAQRLSAYANLSSASSLTAVPFSSVSEFQAFAEKRPVQILLADAAQLGALQEEETRQTGVPQAERLIGLSAKMPARDGSAETTEDALMICDAIISKYQPADLLLRAVMESCQDLRIRRFVPEQLNTRIIGIYSPVSRCGKTALALTLCRALAGRNRVLYLNFEAFSGFSGLTQSKYDATLSDALYHLKQGSLNEQKICALVHTFSGVDYIPPIQFAEDVQTASGEDLADLIETILRESAYRIIVADIGFFREAAAELFEVCSEILMPVLEDTLSKAKQEEFEAYMALSGKKNLKEKLQKVVLPKPNAVQAGENYVDFLLYGPLGDLVRELYG